jgi:hypothetical protein
MMAHVLSDVVMVFLRWIGLIVRPYATMRSIAQQGDRGQWMLIWTASFVYFLFTNPARIFVFGAHMGWIWLVLGLMNRSYTGNRLSIVGTFTLFAYALLPTQLWFIVNYMLSYILPPPRTMSLQGQFFSVIFVGFSISMLLWKFILVYLAVRYSVRQPFYRVVYTIILAAPGIVTISYIAYVLGISKVPYL